MTRFRQAIEAADAFKTPAGKSTGKESRRLNSEAEKQQDYLRFLTAAVARLNVPLAIPVLSDIVQRPDRPEDADFVRLRRQALLALSVMGDKVRNFSKLPEEQQTSILENLQRFAERDELPVSAWARTALFYLDQPRLQRLLTRSEDTVHVDRAMARCAEADDPFARRMVAWTLRFWDGDLVEPTLEKLSRDDGHGKLLKD